LKRPAQPELVKTTSTLPHGRSWCRSIRRRTHRRASRSNSPMYRPAIQATDGHRYASLVQIRTSSSTSKRRMKFLLIRRSPDHQSSSKISRCMGRLVPRQQTRHRPRWFARNSRTTTPPILR
jgi:hypothetical protein